MNLERDVVAALVEWLATDHCESAADSPDDGRVGWEQEPALESLHCDPDLVARLAEVARPLGAVRRRFVCGCPVIRHPGGRPIAAAAGTAWVVVRSGLPAGALTASEPTPPSLGVAWVALDPWGTDIAFARVIDLLRVHLARAYELAEAEAEAGA